MKLKLISKQPEPGGVTTFTWQPESPLSWQPGQYMQYQLPHPDADDRGTERWFTIAAPPFEGRPKITTRLSDQKGSSFKRALANLNEGDSIEADQPEGDFVLDPTAGRYVWLAGGIGATPFYAMLSQMDHDGQMPAITLLYGNRDADAPYRKVLDQLSAKYPQLQVHYIVEPERIDEAKLKSLVPDLAKPDFYVSGPEPMVENFDEMLERLGVLKDHIHNDFFPGYVWP